MDILFTSTIVKENKLNYDLVPDVPINRQPTQKKSNYRYEGSIEIKFFSSGNFSGMTENEVSELILVKILQSGLFKR